MANWKRKPTPPEVEMDKGSNGIYDRPLEKTPEQLLIGARRLRVESSSQSWDTGNS